MYDKKMRLRKKSWWFWTKIIIILGALGLFLGTATAAILVLEISKKLPTTDQIVNRQVAQSTKFYDRTGEVVLYEMGNDRKRTVLTFDRIPQSIKDATIAIEDERFYSEPAFDLRGIMRSVYVNLTRGGIVQGGSTITQQLARKAFLSDEQTFTRKIKELLLAIKISKFYTKDEILGLYLNEIPYGPTIYGIESASHAYFEKSAVDLDVAQAAVLAAIPKAPTFYSPWGSHTKELLNRQQIVLKQMYDQGKISQQVYEQAKNEKIEFAVKSEGIKAPHFVFMVLDQLLEEKDKYTDETIRTGGLKVITTLDWKLQEAAEKAVADGAARNEKLYKGKNAALVAQDPKTGQILALVGSRDYFDKKIDGNFNVAADGLRQPGSTLKPFVYMTAFEKGYTPETVIFDVPTEFSANNPDCPLVVDFKNENTSCFHPENYDHEFHGAVSLKTALPESRNIPAVKTLYLAGLHNVIEKVQTYGLRTLNNPDQYGLSLVLGGGAVKLVDLVEAYSVLAQDGIRHQQNVILEVRDNKNQVLEMYRDQNQQVIDAQYPRMINGILSDPALRAGLFQSNLSLTVIPGYQVALKTGTSNDYRDAWTVGYTPFLVAGIWAGNNDNTPMQRSGGSILAAVPIWNSFMVEAVKHFQPESFTPPEETVSSGKPMLNGQSIINGGSHSILYYVDKNDPNGPAPEHPENDPQFINWETGVSEWTKTNTGQLVESLKKQLETLTQQASPQNQGGN